MMANGHTRRAAAAKKVNFPTIPELVNRGGKARVSEAMPNVGQATRQGGKSVSQRDSAVPSIPSVTRQGGGR